MTLTLISLRSYCYKPTPWRVTGASKQAPPANPDPLACFVDSTCSCLSGSCCLHGIAGHCSVPDAFPLFPKKQKRIYSYDQSPGDDMPTHKAALKLWPLHSHTAFEPTDNNSLLGSLLSSAASTEAASHATGSASYKFGFSAKRCKQECSTQ